MAWLPQTFCEKFTFVSIHSEVSIRMVCFLVHVFLIGEGKKHFQGHSYDTVIFCFQQFIGPLDGAVSGAQPKIIFYLRSMGQYFCLLAIIVKHNGSPDE